VIDLQPLVGSIFERNRYREDIDYTRSLDPPLTPEQAAWMAKRLEDEESERKPPAAAKRGKRRRER
jgi:hypothetical protein